MRNGWWWVLPATALLATTACGNPDVGTRDGREVYVDVRTPAEFAEGHVRGAILIPLEELEQRIGELEQYRQQRLVLYCRSGRRSGIALELLRTRGFDRAENGGAFSSLAAAGLPTAQGPPATD